MLRITHQRGKYMFQACMQMGFVLNKPSLQAVRRPEQSYMFSAEDLADKFVVTTKLPKLLILKKYLGFHLKGWFT